MIVMYAKITPFLMKNRQTYSFQIQWLNIEFRFIDLKCLLIHFIELTIMQIISTSMSSELIGSCKCFTLNCLHLFQFDLIINLRFTVFFSPDIIRM